MEKVIKKDFRTTKDLKLPKSGITVIVYSSLIVGDLKAISLEADKVEQGIVSMVKMIKEWNYFASETDEKPVEINVESISSLPVDDLNFLVEEISKFSESEKKA